MRSQATSGVCIMIIVIDDHPTNVILMKGLVSKYCEHEVLGFEDPQLALEWCVQNTPEIVFVDYMMPVLSGLDFIERFKALPHTQTVPVVMVTAINEKELRLKALQLGASDFIAKPIDQIEFGLRARNLLTMRLMQTQLETRIKEATQQIEQQELELIEAMAKAAEFRDPETGAHTQRVGHYAQLMAKYMGLPVEYQTFMLKAAPMHDLGKIGIRDDILLKPGRLTDVEFEFMKEHPIIGYKIASKSGSAVMKLAAQISLSHHEKWDGSGYPYGLKEDLIPLSGRIVAVADVFDALTSERPYKRAWSLDSAKQFIITNRGTHFCPKCTDVFIQHWDEVLHIRDSLPDDIRQEQPQFMTLLTQLT